MTRAGLQFVIVVFPDHTHVLSCNTTELSTLLTFSLTVIKTMLKNIVQQFIRGMVKIYFGLLNTQLRILIN